jgi:hypothetical protein
MLFTVENQHSKECGTPPAWINAPRLSGEHRAYFENMYGEQWLASATAERLLFTGGDISWQEHRIDKPAYAGLAKQLLISPSLDDVFLNEAERFWLISVCYAAAERT